MTTTEDLIKQEFNEQADPKLPVIRVLKTERPSPIPTFVFCMFEGEMFNGHVSDVNGSGDNVLDKADALAECLENLALSLRVYYEIEGGSLSAQDLAKIKSDPQSYSLLGSGEFFSKKNPTAFLEAKKRRDARFEEYERETANFRPIQGAE